MTTATISRPPTRPPTVTSPERDIARRLTKAGGQLVGVHAMHDNGRSCIDVLDQLSAATTPTRRSTSSLRPFAATSADTGTGDDRSQL